MHNIVLMFITSMKENKKLYFNYKFQQIIDSQFLTRSTVRPELGAGMKS